MIDSALTAIHPQARIAHWVEGHREYVDANALRERVSRVAAQLASTGLQRIALLAANGLDWIVVDLACQQLGIVCLPLPDFFSRAQMHHALQEVGVDAVLTDAVAFVGQLCEVTKIQPLTALSLSLLHIAHAAQAPALPRGTQKITYTSGSTGHPKGVCLTSHQQWAVADALIAHLQLPPLKHLCLLPFAVLLENIAGVYAWLKNGGELMVPPLAQIGLAGSSLCDGKRLVNSITALDVASCILLPQMLQILVQARRQGWPLPPALRFIAVGGAKVAPALLNQARELGLPVYEGYGLSECASVLTLNRPQSACREGVGEVLPHVTLRIENNEIVARGNSFLGYVGDPSSWYGEEVHTGDLGRLDAQGHLHIFGRRKNLMISSFGRNIHPEWIESELMALPGIAQAVLIGDGRPHCIALLHVQNAVLSDADVSREIEALNVRLPDYARVVRWLRLATPITATDGLLTSTGKLIRPAIEQRYADAIARAYNDTAFTTPFFTATNTEVHA